MMDLCPPPEHPRQQSRSAWKTLVTCTLALALIAPGLAAAQETDGTNGPASGLLVDKTIERAVQRALAATSVEPAQSSRPSPPDKRWGHAVLATTMVNVAFSLGNLAFRPAEERYEFKVTPATWWDNLKYGFVFDDNTFQVNQFGHPYQGNLYFNAGRANGLNYWESGLMSALGRVMWECCGETARMSINDFFATSLGGMVVGEVFHRLAALARNPKEGEAGTGAKITAMAFDPIGAVANRKANDNPPASVPDELGSNLRLGSVWRGAGGTLSEAKAYPELEFDFQYGNTFNQESREPFDVFWSRLRLGGGGGISEFMIQGRLAGWHLRDSTSTAIRIEVDQGFEYISNPAYVFGGQAVFVSLPLRRKLSDTASFTLSSGGIILPLGAISAEYVNINQRNYDYGPGGGGTVSSQVIRRGLAVLSAAYTVLAINTVNGSGGAHVAQAFAAEGNVPLFKKLGAGASYRLFQRNSFYVSEPDTFTRYPETRVYLIWRLK